MLSSQQQNPLYVWWQITHRCNLRCIHCFIDLPIQNELSTEEAKKVIDEIGEMKVFVLKITGGEPLCRPDIFDLIKYASDKEISVIMSTNGTLIDKDVAEKLKKSRIETVQISLDGAKKETHEKIRGEGTFEPTIRGIKNIINSGINTCIVTTMMSINADEILDILDLSINFGIKKFVTRRLVMIGRAKSRFKNLFVKPEELLNIYKKLKERKQRLGKKITIRPECAYMYAFDNSLMDSDFTPVCECGRTEFGIKPDGTVTPCEYVVVEAGNVKKQSLNEIWKNADIFKLFRNLNISKLKGKCSECNFKQVCRGGCRASAFYQFNDFFAPDPLCWYEPKKTEKLIF